MYNKKVKITNNFISENVIWEYCNKYMQIFSYKDIHHCDICNNKNSKQPKYPRMWN